MVAASLPGPCLGTPCIPEAFGDRGVLFGWTADALVSLTTVSLVLGVLIAYEALHFKEQRARVHANASASLAKMRG